MSSDVLRLAIAQTSAVPGDVTANAAAAARIITTARERGCELVVFPELSLTGYELAIIATTPDAWLAPDDHRLGPVQQACRAGGITAVLGAPLRTHDGHRRIAAAIVDGTGAVRWSCKEHVHDTEIELFEPGLPAAPFDVAGWRVAVAICFDAARPRHADAAATDGAELYLVSALYVVGEERRADLHLGARAIDHRMFAVLANHASTTGGHTSCGGSGVWGPSGEVLVREMSADDALLVVDVKRHELRRFR